MIAGGSRVRDPHTGPLGLHAGLASVAAHVAFHRGRAIEASAERRSAVAGERLTGARVGDAHGREPIAIVRCPVEGYLDLRVANIAGPTAVASTAARSSTLATSPTSPSAAPASPAGPVTAPGDQGKD